MTPPWTLYFFKSSFFQVLHFKNKNFINVSQFAKDNGVYFEFHSFSCFVWMWSLEPLYSKGLLMMNFINFIFQGSHLVQTSLSPVQLVIVTLPLHLLHQSILQLLVSWVYTANLYSSSNSNLVHCNQSSMSSLDLWHQRLGHPANKIVKLVLNQYKEKFSRNKHFSFCPACQLGKSHKLPFPISNSAYCTPLQIVHLDVWRPAPTLSSKGFW